MSYLEDFEKTLAEKCHQNEPPFCQAACPFRLDIKGLEEKDLSEYGGISGYCVEAVQPSVRESVPACEAGRGNRDRAFRAGDGRVREAEGTECV